jgi:GTP cyclohydrolase I
MELLKKVNESHPRSEKEIEEMIDKASTHYGEFMKALGYDYLADRQTIDTPRRVAKSFLKDITVGSITSEPDITVFPNDDKYDGVVIQTGIDMFSICAHHFIPFFGFASVAYVPNDKVIGLSKLNRVVDWFARRPQIQESLTAQIHKFLSEKLECESVAVSISGKHMCCQMRGIKHPHSVMTTNKFSGVFMEPGNLIREEFLHAISKNGKEF